MNSEPFPSSSNDLWQICAPLIGRHLNMFSFGNELPRESHQGDSLGQLLITFNAAAALTGRRVHDASRASF